MAQPRKRAQQVGPWMSLLEAARALGVVRATVLVQAIKGDIIAQHVAGRTLISRASVEAFLRSRPKTA